MQKEMLEEGTRKECCCGYHGAADLFGAVDYLIIDVWLRKKMSASHGLRSTE